MMNSIIKTMRQPVSRFMWENFVYGDFRRPLKRRSVNVIYWKHGKSDNVGDLLSEVVVDYCKEYYGIHGDQSLSGRTECLLGIGSILNAAKCSGVVWGSGFGEEHFQPRTLRWDVRAVRGPLSRNILIRQGFECPEVFGDPALVLPKFYQPEKLNKNDFLVIPHFLAENGFIERYGDKVLSTRTSDWRGFIDRIASSEFVVSGSLHGIILAEAYGVPAVLLGSSLDKRRLKYQDYFLGTGREEFRVATSVEEALTWAPDFVPDFSTLRTNLLSAFPKDLWVS